MDFDYLNDVLFKLFLREYIKQSVSLLFEVFTKVFIPLQTNFG